MLTSISGCGFIGNIMSVWVLLRSSLRGNFSNQLTSLAGKLLNCLLLKICVCYNSEIISYQKTWIIICMTWHVWIKNRGKGVKVNSKVFMCVVYFDQQTGAPHAARWSKCRFSSFFVKKEGKEQNTTKNHWNWGVFLAFGSYSQKLVETLLWLEKC